MASPARAAAAQRQALQRIVEANKAAAEAARVAAKEAVDKATAGAAQKVQGFTPEQRRSRLEQAARDSAERQAAQADSVSRARDRLKAQREGRAVAQMPGRDATNIAEAIRLALGDVLREAKIPPEVFSASPEAFLANGDFVEGVRVRASKRLGGSGISDEQLARQLTPEAVKESLGRVQGYMAENTATLPEDQAAPVPNAADPLPTRSPEPSDLTEAEGAPASTPESRERTIAGYRERLRAAVRERARNTPFDPQLPFKGDPVSGNTRKPPKNNFQGPTPGTPGSTQQTVFPAAGTATAARPQGFSAPPPEASTLRIVSTTRESGPSFGIENVNLSVNEFGDSVPDNRRFLSVSERKFNPSTGSVDESLLSGEMISVSGGQPVRDTFFFKDSASGQIYQFDSLDQPPRAISDDEYRAFAFENKDAKFEPVSQLEFSQDESPRPLSRESDIGAFPRTELLPDEVFSDLLQGFASRGDRGVNLANARRLLTEIDLRNRVDSFGTDNALQAAFGDLDTANEKLQTLREIVDDVDGTGGLGYGESDGVGEVAAYVSENGTVRRLRPSEKSGVDPSQVIEVYDSPMVEPSDELLTDQARARNAGVPTVSLGLSQVREAVRQAFGSRSQRTPTILRAPENRSAATRLPGPQRIEAIRAEIAELERAYADIPGTLKESAAKKKAFKELKSKTNELVREVEGAAGSNSAQVDFDPAEASARDSLRMESDSASEDVGSGSRRPEDLYSKLLGIDEASVRDSWLRLDPNSPEPPDITAQERAAREMIASRYGNSEDAVGRLAEELITERTRPGTVENREKFRQSLDSARAREGSLSKMVDDGGGMVNAARRYVFGSKVPYRPGALRQIGRSLLQVVPLPGRANVAASASRYDDMMRGRSDMVTDQLRQARGKLQEAQKAFDASNKSAVADPEAIMTSMRGREGGVSSVAEGPRRSEGLAGLHDLADRLSAYTDRRRLQAEIGTLRREINDGSQDASSLVFKRKVARLAEAEGELRGLQVADEPAPEDLDQAAMALRQVSKLEQNLNKPGFGGEGRQEMLAELRGIRERIEEAIGSPSSPEPREFKVAADDAEYSEEGRLVSREIDPAADEPSAPAQRRVAGATGSVLRLSDGKNNPVDATLPGTRRYFSTKEEALTAAALRQGQIPTDLSPEVRQRLDELGVDVNFKVATVEGFPVEAVELESGEHVLRAKLPVRGGSGFVFLELPMLRELPSGPGKSVAFRFDEKTGGIQKLERDGRKVEAAAARERLRGTPFDPDFQWKGGAAEEGFTPTGESFSYEGTPFNYDEAPANKMPQRAQEPPQAEGPDVEAEMERIAREEELAAQQQRDRDFYDEELPEEPGDDIAPSARQTEPAPNRVRSLVEDKAPKPVQDAPQQAQPRPGRKARIAALSAAAALPLLSGAATKEQTAMNDLPSQDPAEYGPAPDINPGEPVRELSARERIANRLAELRGTTRSRRPLRYGTTQLYTPNWN